MIVRLLIVFFVGAIVAWAVIVIPLTFLASVVLGSPLPPVVSFLMGMVVGGLTGPILMSSERVDRWVDR